MMELDLQVFPVENSCHLSDLLIKKHLSHELVRWLSEACLDLTIFPLLTGKWAIGYDA